jgi:lysophospholipase L1-like esterase
VTSQPLPLPSRAYAVVVPESYPFKLQALLRARYTDQEPVVVNEGVGGEYSDQGAERLPGALRAHAPQVLILMHGVNDLNLEGRDGIRTAIRHLDEMMDLGRRAGADVLVATLPPQRAGGPKADAGPLLEEFNQEIRVKTAQRGHTLVDLAAAFGGGVSEIGADGLHPTEAGYERIAQLVFDSIKAKYEEQ